MPREAPAPSRIVNHNAMVFLSLALLLLAFFALLNSMSTIEESRSRRVVDSVAAAFSSPFASRSSKDATEPVADVALAERVFSEIATVFRRAVELVEVEVLHPGRLMQVSLPVDQVFVPRTAQIAAQALLERMAVALAEPPDGVRLDLEVSFEYASGARSTANGLRIARAGALARALVNRGVAAERIVVGLGPGRASTMRLLFHLRPGAGTPLDVQPVLGG